MAGGLRGARRAQVLAAGALLAALATLLVLAQTAAVADLVFETLRQRGLSLARFLALSSEAALRDGRSADLQGLLARSGGDEDLVYLEAVDAAGNLLAERGSSVRPPAFALFDRSVGASRAPAARADVVTGLRGEPLYVFSVPIESDAATGAPPGAEAPQAAGPGLGPRTATAGPRPRPAAARLVLGEIRLAFSPARLEASRKAVAWQGVGLGLLAVLAGTLATHVMARRLVGAPAGRLEEMSEQVSGELSAIQVPAAEVVAGSHGQQESLQRISAAAEAMARSIKNIAGGVGSLSSLSEETSTSIMAMVASIEEVAGHADGLTMSVNDTAATTEELVQAIKEIDRNVELLNQFVTETSQAMAQMGRAIQQVERNAADSEGLSEVVAQNAEKGMRAVELTIEGMEGIRGSVAESSRVIEALGGRGQEIGLILNVIQEVAEQTNLLALNAAIIAAQAGEHGRGFAVVAEEIRMLAERTATSAKEIGNLIGSFQEETRRAVAAMQAGSRKVEDGSERSREAGRALNEILESARRSSTMAGEIAAATREQASGSQAIGASVEKVRDMVAHIKKATAEQTLGSEQIMSAVENMREMAGHVKRATVEQTRGSKAMTQAIDQVTDMVASIHRAAAEQASTSDTILQVLTGFASLTAANQTVAARMQEALLELRARAQELRAAIAHFAERG
jgi:methyl-accepting chemotaxis protein